MSKNILAAIDVGTTKVCTIIAQTVKGRLQILGVGVTPSRGLRKGMVVNLDETKESIRASVDKAQNVSGITIDSAYVGITGRHVGSLNNRSAIAIRRNDQRVSSEDLKRVLKGARTVDMSRDRELLHVIPRQYSLDGSNVGVRRPLGMHGFRLDLETHIITGAMTSVQNLVKCIRGVGIDVEDLVLEPLASSEAVLSDHEKEAGVIIADIGGGTTDIAVFKDGSIFHTAVLPVAGTQVTRDIAIGLGISFEMAEEMKKRYGNLLAGGGDRKPKSQTRGLSATNSGGDDHSDLNEIIRARMEEILKLILMELPSSQYATLVPAGLVLTGGTANLTGIDALAQEVLRLPARTGMPRDIYGLSDTLRDPAYATSVGLLYWAAKHHTDEGWRQYGRRHHLGGILGRVLFQASRLFRR